MMIRGAQIMVDDFLKVLGVFFLAVSFIVIMALFSSVLKEVERNRELRKKEEMEEGDNFKKMIDEIEKDYEKMFLSGR